VQTKSNFADSSEMKDTSMLSEQELPGQHALDNEGVNAVDKATDANGDPSKDSDHTIDVENTTVDEPDCTLDSVEVISSDNATDSNGDHSKDYNHTIDSENINVDDQI